jgi:hypothetical protein
MIVVSVSKKVTNRLHFTDWAKNDAKSRFFEQVYGKFEISKD